MAREIVSFAPTAPTHTYAGEQVPPPRQGAGSSRATPNGLYRRSVVLRWPLHINRPMKLDTAVAARRFISVIRVFSI